MKARYLRLLAVQLRASLLLGMQYRADFVLDALVEVFWMATAIVPLLVVYDVRSTVAGWSRGEALLVMGWFTFLQGVLEGAISPGLATVVEHIRKGTLDFVLVKPADAQFLVSTARLHPWRAVNVLTALAIFAWGFRLLGRAPTLSNVATAVVALFASVSVLYALWMLTVSAAFYVVRIDNLSQLFSAIFDAARWPVDVFRGAVWVMFTFVVPLALMTTYPAEALLGRLAAGTLAGALAGGVAALTLSRAVWLASIRRYTSAGG
ncbi:MAG TPA: ABC-2 family transporter protein [Polyangiaceae bacterium]|nr:ABC-2 family transporter protein [Polyangiaceae bacterium]